MRPDFALLERLRARFLDAPAEGGDYWDAPELLAAYDTTFAERIGWKWDSVLAELRARRWAPPAGSVVLDWGCGSGVAGRRVIAAFGAGHFSRLVVHDRSALARRFAAERATAAFPGLAVEQAPDWGNIAPAQPFTLVLSHVLNELPPVESAALLALVRRAAAVLWVEPGAGDVARALVALRENLRNEFTVVAPCTHNHACGLLTPENQRHWCHHFARPPIEAFTDAFWSEFSLRLNIDLRSLPYSFLVLDRPAARSAAAPVAEEWSRILGEPREYKGHFKVLSCEAAGVTERMLQQRDDKPLFKAFRRGVPAPPLFVWKLREGKIATGRHWSAPDTAAPEPTPVAAPHEPTE